MSGPLHLFKKKLTNLSSANPLLWMSRLRAGIHLDLTEWEMAEGKPVWEILDAILGGQKKIALCRVFNPADRFSNQFSQKAGRILRQKNLLFQERGVDELYVAYPFIGGLWPDGSPLRMPFLFIPVRMEAIENQWFLFPELLSAFINPAFLLAYAHHTGAALPESVFEKDLDLEAGDARTYLTALYHKIKESGLQIHFNQDLFTGRILPFQTLSKDADWPGFQPGMMKLSPHAVLGLFSQSESVLLPDFRFLEEQDVPLEDIFLKALPPATEIREENLLCPLPADGSQEACIRRVKAGQSIVIQGPPGTGKSQVITNLMADAMGSGKTVLLVCQKRVALEVVQKRLKDLGLDSFAAMWSDFKKDRDPLYARLAAAIGRLADTEAENRHLDTVILERNFLKICRNIEEITAKLENWKAALYQKDLAGISVRDLYEAVKQNPCPPFESDFLSAFGWEEWHMFTFWFMRYRFDFQAALNPDSVLWERKNWAGFAEKSPEFFNRLTGQWHTAALAIRPLYAEPDSFPSRFDSFPFQAAAELPASAEELKFENQILFEPDFLSFSQKKISLSDVKEKAENWIRQTEGLLAWPGELVAEKSDIQDLLEIYTERKTLLDAGLPIFVKWFLLPSGRPFLQHLKKANRAGIRAKQWAGWLKEVQNWYSSLDELQKAGLFPDAPAGHAPDFATLNRALLLQCRKMAGHFLLQCPVWERIQNQAIQWNPLLLPACFGSTRKFLETMQALQCNHLVFKQVRESWEGKFRIFQKEDFLKTMGSPESLIQELERNKEAIQKADGQFQQQVPAWESMVRDIFSLRPGEKKPEEWTAFLDAAWSACWIKRIETQFPVLMETGSPSWAEEIGFLQNQIEEKARLTTRILQLRLSENSCKNLEYNRLNNRVSYRELFHQVSKKRMKKPLRSLWQNHAEEIKKLVPAWLATPESVSATWDMHTRFDLVIFDESSQCFAEKGLPAAYRGDTLVVVGDSKQLQPNQHFMARWDEADEEDAVSGQVSLLDLACQFLPQYTLRGHYRSQYPELIAFSNAHFYQNKLEFLPHASALRNRPPAIRWVQTAGIWKDQQNEAEARAIAESIFDFAYAHPGESLGIIAFNIRQQMLIEQFADAISLEQNRTLPASFFIKNIENVQGDECDHLWFSIAYAPNEAGKIHYQFGSLSQAGGENRLNVAITRARKSISVFCSLEPGRFDPGPQAPAGPSLLRQFLEYAREVHLSGMRDLQSHAFSEKNWWQQLQDTLENNAEDERPELRPHDGNLLYSSISVKDFFGYKPLVFKEKGYKVEFRYARPQVQVKASSPKTAS